MRAITLIQIAGVIFCIIGIILCLKLRQKDFKSLSKTSSISIGNVPMFTSSFWKILAFIGVIILPLLVVLAANYNTFEGSRTVGACGRCHVMLPMVNDMITPSSNTLAARHFKNRWINQNQCYGCHADYGVNGDFKAKMEGFRHLARYTTNTYHEPIRIRGKFNNDNCLKCHEGTPKFHSISSHKTAAPSLSSNSISCLNCHGLVHPTAAQRTPGSSDYSKLMQPISDSDKEKLK